MRHLLLFTLALTFSLGLHAQQSGDIYGLEFRTSELRLAKADPNTGQVTVLSNAPTSPDQFGSGISDLDPDGERYFYVRNSQIITVDLNTGNVIHNPTVTCATHPFNSLLPISNIAYNRVDDRIYGVLHYGPQLWFATINPVTGVMTVLSNGPISGEQYQSGVADIDPYTGRYFYVRSNMIYTVDINSSTVVEMHPIQNPNGVVAPFTNIAYNWLTDELFGLEYIGAQFGGAPAELRLVTVDPYSGVRTILSNQVLSADLFQSGVSDIDPVNDVYYYIRDNAILTVSLSTGALLDYEGLSNPNSAVLPFTNIEVVKDYNVTPLPTALFEPTMSGQEVSFKNTSAFALHSTWDFGDGSYSTEKHPVHTFTAPGIYDVVLTTENRDGSTEVVNQQVEVSAPTSIEEEAGLEFSFYPNPAQDVVTIETDAQVQLTVTDLGGRIVMAKQIPAGRQTINASSLNNGIYHIAIDSQRSGTLNRTLVIAR